MLLPVKESRDLGEGVIGGAYPGSSGGFFAPLGFNGKVVEALKFHSDMFESSTIITTLTGNPLPTPNTDDTSVSGELITENTQFTDADIQTVEQTILGAYKFTSKIIRVSIELLQEVSSYDWEGWLADQFAVRIARAATPYLTTGSGIGQPTGIITAATASGQTVIGDDNAESPDPTKEVGVTDLLNLESSVDVAYRRRGSWLMHGDTLQAVKGLRDKSGRPIWTAGLLDDDTGRILGHRVYLDNAMDKLGHGAKSVAFGDLSKYVVRTLPISVTRLTQSFADYGQVAFVAIQRLDGQLMAAGSPVKYLQNA